MSDLERIELALRRVAERLGFGVGTLDQRRLIDMLIEEVTKLNKERTVK